MVTGSDDNQVVLYDVYNGELVFLTLGALTTTSTRGTVSIWYASRTTTNAFFALAITRTSSE